VDYGIQCKQDVAMKCWYSLTRLYGVITHKTTILIPPALLAVHQLSTFTMLELRLQFPEI
jgi:hypothetical protein